MKLENKSIKKAVLAAGMLGVAISGGSSFFNEAQATGGGNYIISNCWKNGNWNNYQCTASTVGNCAASTPCS